MTRKHFEALADALAVSRPETPSRTNDTRGIGAYRQWVNDVYHVADVCARFNDAFDKERFVQACVAR